MGEAPTKGNPVKIHHVVQTSEEKWVFDPVVGPVKRNEPTLSRSGIELITHEGRTYEIQPDGSFEVDEETGRFFARQPGWQMGPSPFPVEEVHEYRPARLSNVAPRPARVGRPAKSAS